jgi:hypothetical protein
MLFSLDFGSYFQVNRELSTLTVSNFIHYGHCTDYTNGFPYGICNKNAEYGLYPALSIPANALAPLQEHYELPQTLNRPAHAPRSLNRSHSSGAHHLKRLGRVAETRCLPQPSSHAPSFSFGVLIQDPATDALTCIESSSVYTRSLVRHTSKISSAATSLLSPPHGCELVSESSSAESDEEYELHPPFSRHELVRSLRKTHGSPKHECTSCGRRFSRPSGLMIHERTHSKDLRQFSSTFILNV